MSDALHGLRLERLSWLVWPAVLVLIQQVFFGAPAGSFLSGIILGLITSLVSLGMYLVFRANRVLNFASGELGLLPAVLAVMLIVESGLSWWLGLGIGLVASLVVGVASEFLIIRRFFEAPRLVVTVATIGLAQLLALCAVLIPRWWDAFVTSQRIDAPFEIEFEVGSRVFTADHVVALVAAPLTILGVGALLRWTRIGIAIRAAAELPQRANLLGIPVKALQSVVWGLATLLGFIALFLRAGIYGLPVGGQLGLLLLLRSLAALTLGRMVHLPTILATSIALGILQEGVVWNSQAVEAEAIMAAITGAVIIAGLLARRTRGLRSEADSSSWQSVGDTRPIPFEFRSLPIVRYGRPIGIAAFAAILLVFPSLPWFDATVVVRMGLIFLFAIVILSLGVLTGWAGQLSLGQMAFAGVGGAVSAWITLNWQWDITLAVLVAGVFGAVVSLVIGLPALRLRGMYLAVTTLAFGLTVSQYFLNPRFFDWIPEQRVERLPIFGVIDWSTSRGIYYVSLVAMILAFLAVQGIRRSRTGRVLIAMRDNEIGTEAYGVDPVRAKLTAFAISGFLAAAAGALLTHHHQAFWTYDAGFSLGIFTAAVIGGLGSLLGAFLGALYWNGTYFWLEGTWRLFVTGFGVLFILLVAPGGMVSLWTDLRDLALRWLGRRRDLTGEVLPDTDDGTLAVPTKGDPAPTELNGVSHDLADDLTDHDVPADELAPGGRE